MNDSPSVARNDISINAVARKIHDDFQHDAGLKRQPTEPAWSQLTAAERKMRSRFTRSVIDAINIFGFRIRFTDEYEIPMPGDSRWEDPEAQGLSRPMGSDGATPGVMRAERGEVEMVRRIVREEMGSRAAQVGRVS